MLKQQQIGSDVDRELRFDLRALQLEDRLTERGSGGIDQYIDRPCCLNSLRD